MTDLVNQCDMYLRIATRRCKIRCCNTDDVPSSPLSKVAVDLCFHFVKVLLVVIDYFSSFVEIDSLSSETSQSVIRSLMGIISRFGVPDTLVTDNGTHFATSELAKCAEQWTFSTLRQVPCYSQSNDKAENAERTVKALVS